MIFIPTIYLSPSTQEYNQYVTGGNEEQYMNLIADAMIPYLNASGISYVRNDPNKTVGNSIRGSNSGNYDLHLALHSNASGGVYGANTGAEFYYYPYSTKGQMAAEIFANNFKMIYPNPNKVRSIPTTTLTEIRRTKAPTVLAEIAYHDNVEDANWIKSNVDLIAKNLVISLCDIFDIPFNMPSGPFAVRIRTMGSNLNIRQRPDINSPIIGKVPNGTVVYVFGTQGEWFLIGYNGVYGYINANYTE